MARSKAPDIDWLNQAWRIAIALEKLPAKPYNALASLIYPEPNKSGEHLNFKNTPTAQEVRAEILDLQEKISDDILRKLRNKCKIEKGSVEQVASLLNQHMGTKAAECVRLAGPAAESATVFHFHAHRWLGEVHRDCYLARTGLWRLPLLVASIGGDFTSDNAKWVSTLKRPNADRRKPLSVAIGSVLSANESNAAIHIFNRLRNQYASNCVEVNQNGGPVTVQVVGGSAGSHIEYLVGNARFEQQWHSFAVMVARARVRWSARN
ncbi:MAG: hypothetical protein H7332_05220 [Bdellovibrionales bacterium]|nr:hypothetical protein [Ramlibacter sp.]